MARKPAISIVGCGRVGGAIGLALARNGYEVTAIWSRSRAGRQRAHRLLEAPVLEPVEAAAAGDVVFLTVPDDAIGEMASQIAPGVGKKTCVVHTSGGASISELRPAAEAGARTGSLHPLQTIPDAERGAESLVGAGVAVTCADPDRRALSRIARGWGGRPFPLPDDAKAVYHSAAVFASNYIVSSVWAAATLLRSIGLAGASELLGPLVRASVDNVLLSGGAKAITGPVARGDLDTVRSHVAALREADPAGGPITDAYRSLATLTAALQGGDVEGFRRATA